MQPATAKEELGKCQTLLDSGSQHNERKLAQTAAHEAQNKWKEELLKSGSTALEQVPREEEAISLEIFKIWLKWNHSQPELGLWEED